MTDTTLSEPGLSMSILKQENALTDIPKGQFGGSNSSFEVLSSQVTLVCVKLTSTNHHA